MDQSQNSMPNQVETIPPFDTKIKFWGFAWDKLLIAVMIVVIGGAISALLALWLIFPIFLTLAGVTLYYEKDGMTVWVWLFYKLLYGLSSKRLYEGEEETKSFVSVNDIEPSMYEVGKDNFYAIMVTGGVQLNHISQNEKLNKILSFRELLNHRKFTFPMQIIAKPHLINTDLYEPAPYLGDDVYSESQHEIAEALHDYVHDMGNQHRIYSFYIVLKTKVDGDHSREKRKDIARDRFKKRFQLISRYLVNMGVDHQVASGEQLVNVLKMLHTGEFE